MPSIQTLPVLYCRNINGRILQYQLVIQCDGIGCKLIAKHGILNSKITSSILTVSSSDDSVKPKLIKLAESKYRTKQKHGYKSFIDLGISDISKLELVLPKFNSDNDFQLKPMKAQKINPINMLYPTLGQPKINGIRCIARLEIAKTNSLFGNDSSRVVLRSKEGHEYVLPHISEELFNLYVNNSVDANNIDDIVFDGELYIPGRTLNYIKASVPMINQYGTLSKSTNNPEEVQFWMFDLAIEDTNQLNRLLILNELIKPIKRHEHYHNHNCLVVVPTIDIHDSNHANKYRDECINLGYEGCILRDRNAQYCFGQRPSTMIKMKKYLDGEFIIVDIIPKPKETETALFVLKNDINSELFECNPEGTYEERKDYLDNKELLLGKLATVKYYERSGIKKVPFHANVITIRDYEK